jgi:hypothetical protein
VRVIICIQVISISTGGSGEASHKEEGRPSPKKLFIRHKVGEELLLLVFL